MSVLELPPPDRRWRAPVSGFGIDTVRLRGPAEGTLLAQLPEKRSTAWCDDTTGELLDVQRSGYTAIAAGQTFVRVKADLRHGTPEVAVEFSAPSVLAGHNRDPLPLERLPDVAQQVYEAMQEELTGLPEFDEFRLLRLDVDRDFTAVRSIGTTLAAVALRPVSRARIDRLERGSAGAWQSLTRGNSRSWLAVGYGKGEQLAEAATKTYDDGRRRLLRSLAQSSYGTLRWELQLRRDTLRQHGMSTLDQLDEERTYEMSKKFFDRTRFADSIAGNSQRLREALADLSSAKRRGVLALLAADLHGFPAPMSHGLEDECRALARRLGLAPHDLDVDGGEALRLDFDAGREVSAESQHEDDAPDDGPARAA